MTSPTAWEVPGLTNGPPTVLVAGLGNCLLTDDGIGVHAVRLLQLNPPPAVLPVEIGTDLFSLVPLLAQVSQVLAIDAMDAGGIPGTLYRCGARDIIEPARKTSLHEMGLISVLEFAPAEWHPEITILGVQPATIKLGLELSPELQLALPKVVETARAIARELARAHHYMKTRSN